MILNIPRETLGVHSIIQIDAEFAFDMYGYNFYFHEAIEPDDESITVRELTTGARITGRYDTSERAIAAAKKRIESLGQKQFDKRIANAKAILLTRFGKETLNMKEITKIVPPTIVVHELKTLPIHFEEIYCGCKKFEVRKNDRFFKVPDILHLREYEQGRKEWNGTSRTDGYSSREIICEVTSILFGCKFGIAADHCVMSIKVLQSWPLKIYYP